MKFISTLAGLTLAYLAFGAGPSPALAASSAPTPLSNTSIELCKNRPFALCAASTCTPTGNQIAVNTPDGGTRSFPEADCTCPVLPEGDTGAIANVRGGNMKGSCESPPGGVWSLYQPEPNFPQEAYGWNVHKAALNPTCKADLNLGRRFANCFSFKCDNIRTITSQDGTRVTVATCHCPLGEDVFSALPTKPDTGFGTEAGGDMPTYNAQQSFCYKYPVGGF